MQPLSRSYGAIEHSPGEFLLSGIKARAHLRAPPRRSETRNVPASPSQKVQLPFFISILSIFRWSPNAYDDFPGCLYPFCEVPFCDFRAAFGLMNLLSSLKFSVRGFAKRRSSGCGPVWLILAATGSARGAHFRRKDHGRLSLRAFRRKDHRRLSLRAFRCKDHRRLSLRAFRCLKLLEQYFRNCKGCAKHSGILSPAGI